MKLKEAGRQKFLGKSQHYHLTCTRITRNSLCPLGALNRGYLNSPAMAEPHRRQQVKCKVSERWSLKDSWCLTSTAFLQECTQYNFPLTLTVTMLTCCAFSNVLISLSEVIGNPSFSFSIFSRFRATISLVFLSRAR